MRLSIDGLRQMNDPAKTFLESQEALAENMARGYGFKGFKRETLIVQIRKAPTGQSDSVEKDISQGTTGKPIFYSVIPREPLRLEISERTLGEVVRFAQRSEPGFGWLTEEIRGG